jgi:hypothetical protein
MEQSPEIKAFLLRGTRKLLDPAELDVALEAANFAVNERLQKPMLDQMCSNKEQVLHIAKAMRHQICNIQLSFHSH